MSNLKVITYKEIKDLNPCYDPIKFIPKDWKGTALDILSLKDVPHNDKLWCVLRPELISHKTMRLFAVWCAREALKLIYNPDPRSIECVLVAERFAKGDATLDELRLARDAAYPAANASAYYAANASANAAAHAAAGNTAVYAAMGNTAVYAAQVEKLIEMIKEEENNV